MRIIAYLLLFLIPLSAHGQKVVDQTVQAINASNASKVAGSFDKVVDLTLNNEQSTYSKSQATIVLKKFFSRNNVKSFTVKHKGSPVDNASVYLIGNLVTENGQNFRLYLFFKQKNDGLYLQEVRIDN